MTAEGTALDAPAPSAHLAETTAPVAATAHWTTTVSEAAPATSTQAVPFAATVRAVKRWLDTGTYLRTRMGHTSVKRAHHT